MPAPPRPHRPAWPRLAGLAAAVLAVHALLLTDDWPSWRPSPSGTSPVGGAPAIDLQTSALPSGMQAMPPRPAGLSTVRWLPPPATQAVSAPAAVAPQAASPPPRTQPKVAKEPSSAPRAAEAAPATDTQAAVDAETPAPPELEAPGAPTEVAASQPAAMTEPAAEPSSPTEPAPATNLPDDTEQVAPARRNRTEGSAAEVRLPPAQPPASAQLDYAVTGKAKGLAYTATGRLDWTASPTAYDARMEIRVFLLGSRSQTSQGALVASGLQPTRFGDKSRSERAAHFNRTLGRIRFSNNAPDAELLPGAQDRLSVFFQLAGLLNARPEAYATGQSVAIPVAGTGGSELWRFEVQGLEPLNLPAGELIARHLVREPRQAYDTKVDIWLAPSLGHLPVRIRITQDNGDVVDQQLSAKP